MSAKVTQRAAGSAGETGGLESIVARSPESLRLARAILDLPTFTVAELREITGINENTIYGFVSRLRSRERLVQEESVSGSDGPGRPRKRFTLTDEGTAALTGETLRVAATLVGEPAPEPAVEAEPQRPDILAPFRAAVSPQLEEVLARAVELRADQVLLQPGHQPYFRAGRGAFSGRYPFAFSDSELTRMAAQILSPHQTERLRLQGSVEAAVSVPGIGRFVGEVAAESGALTMRWHPMGATIPTLDELGLESLRPVTEETHGLTLIVGSSPLDRARVTAALLEEINRSKVREIANLGRPLTYLHHNDRSLFHHVEIGVDAPSFDAALRRSAHAEPQVLRLSELAGGETTTKVLALAQHRLVLAEVTATEGALALEQLLQAFPPGAQQLIAQRLGRVLRWVVTVPSHGRGATTISPGTEFGLQPPCDEDEITELLGLLEDAHIDTYKDWKGRYKQNLDKMKTGDLTSVAEVLKNLRLVSQRKSLSFREKKMYERAKYFIVSEVAHVRDIGEREAEQLVEEALISSIEKRNQAAKAS